MRKLKLIFVENDSALRALLGSMLQATEKIDLLGSFATTSAVLNSALIRDADAALIDFALDSDGLNGVELGIALRGLNENIGIAIYSQYDVQPLLSRVPMAMRSGWSLFEKSSSMQALDYVELLRQTAAGQGNWKKYEQKAVGGRNNESSLLMSLTGRQQEVIRLASQGLSSPEIAKMLGISYGYVRKELSRIYSQLVPDATDAVDLKTIAILKYLELTANGRALHY